MKEMGALLLAAPLLLLGGQYEEKPWEKSASKTEKPGMEDA